MSSKYDSMGKNELRAACKAAGIPYGKLNNDGMRAALASADKLKQTVNEIAAEKASVQEAPADTLVTGFTENAEGTPDGTATVTETTESVDTGAPAEPVVNAPAVAGPKGGKTAGMKIEKDREEKNGVKRPSVGGMCRAVWDALDAILATGKNPEAKDVKALATEKGWNQNNASIELYQWRKFNGIQGRSKKAE